VEIMPGDLIVIAGTPNSGKTALLLDMVYRNMNIWSCHYFSTEMSRYALKKRLIKKDFDSKLWNFKFTDDFSGKYEDVIKPDGLNFIDYVEQNEGEAFKIPGILAKIQRNLKTGVAVVALQKNLGNSYGVGGQQTTAKPTLFLSVESDFPGAILKIVKAKVYKGANPNGDIAHFKILNGIDIIQDTGWAQDV